MTIRSANDFAAAIGIAEQVARRALARAACGKPWPGHHLPVVSLDGRRGGASGKVWGLDLDKASPDLRALLGLPETLPSTSVEPRLKTRPDDRHVVTAVDRQRIIGPMLAAPKGSHARAARSGLRRHNSTGSGMAGRGSATGRCGNG